MILEVQIIHTESIFGNVEVVSVCLIEKILETPALAQWARTRTP